MKKFTKLFAVLTALALLFGAVSVTAAAEEIDPLDMSIIFAPETQLVVYVDKTWSEEMTDVYGYGETAVLTAPVIEGKQFAYWSADGAIVSYANPLRLTINANTTLSAVYAASAPTVKPLAGFTSATCTNDGGSIVLNAVADSAATAAGIVYSTTVKGNSLKIDAENVTHVPAETITESTTVVPQSVLDGNHCWSLQFTPDSEETVYHVRAYVTVAGNTTYSEVKDVKLADLECGVSLVANLEGFNPESGLEDTLSGLTDGMRTVIYYPNGGVGAPIVQAYLGDSVTLRANTFTRAGYRFSGWSTEETGSVLYKDAETIQPEGEVVLYALWNRSGGSSSSDDSSAETLTPIIAATTNGKVTAGASAPKAGEKVTITVTPDAGYEVDTVTVTDAHGNNVPVTKNDDGTYTYTQPSSKVTVKATFKQAQPVDGPQPDGTKPCPKDATCPMRAFTDLDPALWYHDGIHYCLENGLMNGVGEGKFDPSASTSRAMIVTILYRMEKTPAAGTANPFTDVEAGKWYTDAVAWAAANKIVDGYGDGKFGPNDNITREQLAAILFRYAKYKGVDVSVGQDTNILSFEDIGSWSSWSVEALQWAVGSGVMNGKNGKLVPKGDALRSEAAAMIQRFCENVAK